MSGVQSAAARGVRVRSTGGGDGRWSFVLLVCSALLATGGLGIALYLTVVHYAGEPIVCSNIGDCELVNSSRYATVGGVPVALLGAAAYTSMLALVIGALVRRSEGALTAAWGIALASFAFSMYLTYVELRVLDAICVWCVASAGVMTGLLLALSAAVWWSQPSVEGRR